MAKFKPGDIVAATKNPNLPNMASDGFVIGEVVEVLDDTISTFEGQFAVNVLVSQPSKHTGTLLFKVGEELRISGRWFDLVNQ